MVLKTLDTLGSMHGYWIARRIEQTSGEKLVLNYGTLYPALLKLEQEGAIRASWGTSENNRRAKFYELTLGQRCEIRCFNHEFPYPFYCAGDDVVPSGITNDARIPIPGHTSAWNDSSRRLDNIPFQLYPMRAIRLGLGHEAYH